MAKPKGSASTTAAFAAVTTLFFAWGFITSLVDPLVAAVKGIFTLTDFQAQASAFAFFIAYGLISFPAAALLSKLKSVPSIIFALCMMIAGCLVMLVAVNLAVYTLVLLGLFILAAGITILQVAANPLAAALGDPKHSHLRLTLSQTFNSLGTFIGPYLGAVLFLDGLEVKNGTVVTDTVRSASLGGIDSAYFWICGMIAMLAIFFFLSRRVVMDAAPAAPFVSKGLGGLIRDALSAKWALFGGLAIFLYVGAEVSIGTQMAFLLNDDSIWGVSLQDAGKAVSLYWGGAMVGRAIGSALLARVPAATLLATFTGVACLMCAYVVAVAGISAGYVALAIGLFNSIMFPVIFTLTLERSSASAEATSGLLCTAIVGGAFMPLVMGNVSGAMGYGVALLVPALCYAVLTVFAVIARSTPLALRDADEPSAMSMH